MYRRLRIKRAVALLLCFCTLLICTPYQEVNAKEYEEKYLTIKRVNDGQQDTYKIVTDGEEVFISAEQLSELAGFTKTNIVRDDDKLTAVTLIKGEEQDASQDIIISASNNTIYSLRYREREFDGCLDTGEEVYLDLIDMFNYLRIKAEVIDGRLFINVPVYTMYDFMTVDYPEVLKNCVSQLDLLEPGEDLKSSGTWDAVYLACNNFDFRFLVPIWGTNQIKDEQYTKALQTLNEEDETFYNEDTNEYFQSELEGRGLGSCLASGQDLIDTLSVGGGAMDSAEDIIKQLEGLSEADQDALFSLWDTLNWNREDFLKATGLKTFSERAGEISDALTVAEIAVSAYEAYEQAASWSEDCMNDLDVLRNLDADNYGENKDYVKRISKVAEDSYQASLDPENAAEEQFVSDIAELALEKAITETSVPGKVADLFIFSVNLGVSVARCFGNIAEEMDKGELSYMVSCLINIAVASRIDAEVKRDQLDITDLTSGNQLNDFRNSIRTSIKSNLRCWSYIYYLNSNGTWETSERGQYVKGQIDKMHVYLALLDETKQYDYALDEYDLITYSPERIVEIAEESKVIVEPGVIYEHADGEFLSNFHLEQEDNGDKTAYLLFWYNYGASASVEDFFFEWNDQQTTYELVGQRSGKRFEVTFEFIDENTIDISVRCEEEYYNWKTGDKGAIWSDAEYKKVTSNAINPIGEWEIDDSMSMEANGVSMTYLFGSAYKYGNHMTVNSDNSFSYGVGAGVGGEGTWIAKDNILEYNIKRYEDNEAETGQLNIRNENGIMYLIMRYDEYELWWKKNKSIEETGASAADDKEMGEDIERKEYLDELDIIESDQYKGNLADSFVYKLGEHEFSRGNSDVNGQQYSHGIEGWIARWNYEEESSWAYGTFELDKKYSEITGQCVLIESYNTENFDTTLEFWGDGNLIKSYHLTPQTIPFAITIDVKNINKLKIYFYDNKAVKGGTSFGLVGMELKPAK